jgi:hypothetical protein
MLHAAEDFQPSDQDPACRPDRPKDADGRPVPGSVAVLPLALPAAGLHHAAAGLQVAVGPPVRGGRMPTGTILAITGIGAPPWRTATPPVPRTAVRALPGWTAGSD